MSPQRICRWRRRLKAKKPILRRRYGGMFRCPLSPILVYSGSWEDGLLGTELTALPAPTPISRPAPPFCTWTTHSPATWATSAVSPRPSSTPTTQPRTLETATPRPGDQGSQPPQAGHYLHRQPRAPRHPRQARVPRPHPPNPPTRLRYRSGPLLVVSWAESVSLNSPPHTSPISADQVSQLALPS